VYSVAEPEELPVSEATGKPVRDGDRQSEHPFDTEREAERTMRLYRMDMTFIGCNSDVEIEAADPRPQYLNYCLPHCPDGITKVPGFGGLRYKNLYDNIDLVLHASKDGLKYEFEVHPGGRVEDIRMRHDGQDGIEQLGDGTLNILWSKGRTHEGLPYSYQESAAGLVEVASSYSVDGAQVGFDVGSFDETRTLIIDPWSTYYGGACEDILRRITCDANDAVIVVGDTKSHDFPVYRAWQSTFSGNTRNAMIVKFDEAKTVSWATFFGGTNREEGWGLASDTSCNIVISGLTESTDFPAHAAWQPQLRDANGDGYIAKFDSSGARIWATFIGGSAKDAVISVATDGSGNIYATGSTESSDFPLRNAAYLYSSVQLDGFYLKMNPAGSLLFSSYQGGMSVRYNNIAVDDRGGFAVCGTTGPGFQTLNARQPQYYGNTSAFLAFHDSSGAPVWRTYHGGDWYTHGTAVVFDRDRNIIISGFTQSNIFFPLRRAVQNRLAGNLDAFVSKFDRQGDLIWSTYYGGSASELMEAGLACDTLGNVFVVGITASANFPVRNAVIPTRPDTAVFTYPRDGFVVKFDSAGTVLWSTFLGGNTIDWPYSAATDSRGRLFVAGYTTSDNFPIFNAFQDTISGSRDSTGAFPYCGFITGFVDDGTFPVTLSQLAAQRVSGGVELAWRTESEVNAYGFIIERRYEHEAGAANSGWKDIGFLPSTAQGNEGRDYTYLDLDPGTTDMRIFYRLRMVDLDGTFEHSPVVEVAPETGALAVSFEAAYPSPARDWITLNFSLPAESVVNLAVYDVNGREIVRVYDKHSVFAGAQSVVLPVGEWRSGLYFCRLEVCGAELVRRAMVVK
jgi:hypothetical protein